MSKPEDWAFAFEEADHLTRIHLKLALEDVGFEVAEADDVIAIAAGGDLPTAGLSSPPFAVCGGLPATEREGAAEPRKGEGERDEPGDPRAR